MWFTRKQCYSVFIFQTHKKMVYSMNRWETVWNSTYIDSQSHRHFRFHLLSKTFDIFYCLTNPLPRNTHSNIWRMKETELTEILTLSSPSCWRLPLWNRTWENNPCCYFAPSSCVLIVVLFWRRESVHCTLRQQQIFRLFSVHLTCIRLSFITTPNNFKQKTIVKFVQ